MDVLHREINRSRHAIRRAVVALYRPAGRESRRSALRLSLAEREEISRGLAAGVSLRAIARRLGRAPSTVCREVVTHETIYLSLFVQARGALRKELFRCLRTGRARRRPQGLTVMNGQGRIRGMVNISSRPAEAADRAVPGHWEGDTMFGTGRSATASPVVARTQRR